MIAKLLGHADSSATERYTHVEGGTEEASCRGEMGEAHGALIRVPPPLTHVSQEARSTASVMPSSESSCR